MELHDVHCSALHNLQTASGLFVVSGTAPFPMYNLHESLWYCSSIRFLKTVQSVWGFVKLPGGKEGRADIIVCSAS